MGKFVKEWRLRWMVLTKKYLASFNFDIDSLVPLKDYTKPTEVLRLNKCYTIRSNTEETNFENSFCIENQARKLQLIAADQAEKEKWISTVGKIMIGQNMIV